MLWDHWSESSELSDLSELSELSGNLSCIIEIMSIKDELKKQIEEVLGKLGVEGAAVSLDIPADSEHGDYSTNAAMVAFGSEKQFNSPIELAVAMKMALDERDIPFLAKIEVMPPGFVNFRVSESYLLLQLPGIIEGSEGSKGGKGKVVVEYSSPNIAKPFTVGHLRSTIIGDAIANLLEATGWEVHRDNHVGDWGTQFGKQIYAIKAWGNEEEIEKAEQPVKLLVELYVKFHNEAQNHSGMEDEARAWFKKLEDGDPEARRIWEKCIAWSWKEFEGIYAKLGVTFTENDGRGYGESFFEDKMKPVIEELEEKDLLKVGEEGAKLVFFPSDELPPLMILKKDGSTLYATRDLATDKFRLEKYGKDVLVINEVGVEQSLYFRQLYKLEEMLGWFKKDQRVHVRHGHFRFKEGKMSTRKGNVVWLEEVLEEAEKRAAVLGEARGEGSVIPSEAEESHSTELFEQHSGRRSLHDGRDDKLAKVVGIGALKWNDLKRDSKQDIIFDWDDILNMQGNSGPYMQYAYARTQSVLARGKGKGESVKNDLALHPSPFTLHPEERELLRLLVQFSDVVGEAAERLAPNILCTYLFELAQAFNLFYQKHPILKAENDAQHLRLALTEATGVVIKRGLSLLGIESPQKM